MIVENTEVGRYRNIEVQRPRRERESTGDSPARNSSSQVSGSSGSVLIMVKKKGIASRAARIGSKDKCGFRIILFYYFKFSIF